MSALLSKQQTIPGQSTVEQQAKCNTRAHRALKTAAGKERKKKMKKEEKEEGKK
jgi:hypothetical protein